MHSFRAMAWLTILAPLVIGAACSSPQSQPCPGCDAGKSDQADASAERAPAVDSTPIPDTASEEAALDQALAVDQQVPPNQAETFPQDGSRASAADASAGETAGPSPVPDGGVLLVEDFSDGKADGWRSHDWTEAGAPDNDWGVTLGDAGSVYSESSLDKSEWHIVYAGVNAVADQIVEARLRVVEFYDASPSFVAALFARYDPIADSGYFLALRGDGSVIIRKRLQGKSASWAAGVDAGIVPGVWHTVRLEVLGSTINAFLDGILVYSVVDSDPLAAGTAALGAYGATLEVDRVLLAQP
jgi:hypothetical protein